MKIYKAHPTGDQVVPDLEIVANETLPQINIRDEDWERKSRVRYTEQAREIRRQLSASLPGGTMHALLVDLLRDKHSLLRVVD